jgi:hypothetical protein
MMILPNNLGGLADCCADGSKRFGGTCGVELRDMGARTYQVAATDGRKAVIVRGLQSVDAANFPNLPALKTAPNTATTAVVLAKDWKDAFKLSHRTKDRLDIPNSLAVVLGNSLTTFAATDLERARVLQVRNVEGRFPEVDGIIPSGEPKRTVDVDPSLLIDVLKAALAFTDDESKRVTIELRDGGTPIVVRRKNNDQEFIGLVVPLQVSE